MVEGGLLIMDWFSHSTDTLELSPIDSSIGAQSAPTQPTLETSITCSSGPTHLIS